MTDQSKSTPDLAKVLVEQNVISAAQIQLALADKEVTGMSLEEILLARGWITEQALDTIAPWLKKKPEQSATTTFPPGPRTYENSLREYKRLMEKILGTSWD
jgi:hypothetical protein